MDKKCELEMEFLAFRFVLCYHKSEVVFMAQNEMNQEELEHKALQELENQTEKSEYVERPKGQRILAWVLAGVVIVGVLLYFGWIAGILK